MANPRGARKDKPCLAFRPASPAGPGAAGEVKVKTNPSGNLATPEPLTDRTTLVPQVTHLRTPLQTSPQKGELTRARADAIVCRVETYITMAEFGERKGVSRQAINHAIGRTTSPPQPACKMAKMYGYRPEDLENWWEQYRDDMWKERRIAGDSTSVQLNMRVSTENMAILDSLRYDGETRAAAGKRIMARALQAARDWGDLNLAIPDKP